MPSAEDQVVLLRGDIAQVRQLLADAVSRLIGTFGEIAATAAAAKREAGATALAVRIETAAVEAVTCLQFQDLIDQVLDKALDHVGALEHALGEAPQTVDADPAHGARGADKRQRVVQQDMRPGDIELF